ncbi:MAG: carbonic anhydrase [Thermodesulfobacteriota bacterium]
MNRIISVSSSQGIPAHYRPTPIGLLLEYHNLGRPLDSYEKARLLVGMCMDNRKRLRLPDNFAYIIRTGGGNLRYNEFHVSYAIAIAGVEGIALIGHGDCAMVGLASRKELFVTGLVERCGWDPEAAEAHFVSFAPMFEIGNEFDFVLAEARRLRARYPRIPVAPMLYRMEDGLLYLIEEQ